MSENAEGENTRGISTGRGTEQEGTSGNSGSGGNREKAKSYLEQLRNRKLTESESGNGIGSDDDAESGRNGRTDGTGTGVDGQGTGRVPDGTNRSGRSSGKSTGINRQTGTSDSGIDSVKSATGRVKEEIFGKQSPQATTKHSGVSLSIPKEARESSRKKKTIAAVLTDKEAKDLKEQFTGVLQLIFEWQDDAISFTNKERAKAEIWTQLDFEDVGKIASAILSLSKRSAQMAVAVRGMVKSYEYMEAGVITSQKLFETFQFYRKHGGFSIPGVF